ncbi:hypothetical protein [Aureimonas sp. SK2]|uniref:hypothetical protein n=1 Tax=Aureimonas sp. SK2 TaxID=3015992 RepID=UPI0024449AC2|nr:hypothetical protein [Aureimonas sp. SK2]
MTNNPIAVGFPWSQAFDFPPGYLKPGDLVHAEFRLLASDPVPLATAEATIDRDRLYLQLTAEQTNAMIRLAQSTAITNFVIERGGEEYPVGVIVTVPVVLLPTRPRQ